MDNHHDNIRAFDQSVTDQLIRSGANVSVTQNFNNNYDDDPQIALAIEESIKMYEKDLQMSEQIEKLEREQKMKQTNEEIEEVARVQAIRDKLRFITSRLKTVFPKDTIAIDLLQWIEWECTPTHLLTSFRPKTNSSIHEIKMWIKKNLNPSMQATLEEQRFF
jgi:hypothetical protein